MFLGEHRHALDAKGRVIFPVRLREALGLEIVLQKGIDPCVYVYPPKEWDRQVERINELSTTQPNARRFARFFFSQAQNERIDRQGRLTVPPTFREYAGLQRDVVIVGAGARVEIWDATRWEGHRSETERSVEDFAAGLEI